MRDAARQSLAVGFFDGVHFGHQAILRGASAALTFRNHPLTVLAPERAPRLIMSPEERVAAIRACGVADVTMLDFTRELAEMPAEDFVEEFLVKRRGRRFPVIRCGANWRFGKGGEGDAAYLRARGIAVEEISYATYKGERISSSRIRACLERGEIEDANAMLGRRFEVRGQMSEGKGVGTQIGYPTVNLQLSATSLRLPHGVYEVELDGEKGIANYGLAPTMGERAWPTPVLEVHLLETRTTNHEPRIPNHEPRIPNPEPRIPNHEPRTTNHEPRTTPPVAFVRFIRPERKFDSIEALKRQIAADCATIRT